jgi:hypothetical protein
MAPTGLRVVVVTRAEPSETVTDMGEAANRGDLFVLSNGAYGRSLTSAVSAFSTEFHTRGGRSAN